MPDDYTRTGQAAHGPEAALRLQVTRQHGTIDRQAARLDQQSAQIAALAATLRDSDTRISSLIQETHALRQEVADLRSSTSWRITGPLRGLRRVYWWLGRHWRGRF